MSKLLKNDSNLWEWTEWLNLTITPLINCNRVRYYSLYNKNNIDMIDIEYFYNNSWNAVHVGDFKNKDWQIDNLGGSYNISKVRVRFYLRGCLGGFSAKLYEFDFYKLNI
ncbi:MAG: hypothetical protein MUO82_03645 [Candidatus Thermoplasmatota archaeon]|nr:hypothetical protein [Candidatus Thermoplasmatota archaeon]